MKLDFTKEELEFLKQGVALGIASAKRRSNESGVLPIISEEYKKQASFGAVLLNKLMAAV